MKLSEVKKALVEMEAVVFQLPNKSFIPKHIQVRRFSDRSRVSGRYHRKIWSCVSWFNVSVNQ